MHNKAIRRRSQVSSLGDFFFLHTLKMTYLSYSVLEEGVKRPRLGAAACLCGISVCVTGVSLGGQQLTPLLLGGCCSPPRADDLAALPPHLLYGAEKGRVFFHLSWGSEAVQPSATCVTSHLCIWVSCVWGQETWAGGGAGGSLTSSSWSEHDLE